jgi:hypothetical protein
MQTKGLQSLFHNSPLRISQALWEQRWMVGAVGIVLRSRVETTNGFILGNAKNAKNA